MLDQAEGFVDAAAISSRRELARKSEWVVKAHDAAVTEPSIRGNSCAIAPIFEIVSAFSRRSRPTRSVFGDSDTLLVQNVPG